MRKVIGMGETVLDIVFKNNQPYAAVPGGSTFNSMVSLGRAQVPSYFLSEIGSNRPGAMIKDFMEWNGVNHEYVNELPVKQPVSMAFLNEDNDAEYCFYRDENPVHSDFRYPEINRDDIVLFGSFYAVNPAVRSHVKAFLEYAVQRGAILYYDVNFRPAHLSDLGDVIGSVRENYEYSDVVRGSHEDFITLYNEDDADKVYSEIVESLCPYFICTSGSRPLQVRGINSFSGAYPVAPVNPVSTIGAGDSFNAGFVYALIRYGITKDKLSAGLDKNEWDKIIAMAQAFSADCCKSMYNYITPEFAETLCL